MTTAYTSLLGLALPVTGELSGTWGDTVNTAITSLLDTAIAGTTSITTDADITLSTTTGASNEARQAIILWNPASGTVTRNITAPAQSKMYTVINASGGTQSIVIRGAGPTTGVTVLKGESALVAWNGSDFVKVSSIGGAGTFTNLTVTGNTILGDAIGDTLTVNATTSFTAPVNLPSTGRSAAAALTPTNPAFLYGVASTYTDTTSSGTLAPVATFYSLARPTLSTSNVTTYTTAATLYIANSPAAGGSATITNPYALYVAAGNSLLAGNLLFTDNTYDIGASGATRPRTLYLGTSLITPSITDSGLTSGRVTYAGASGLLQDSANLTFNGTTLVANDITDSSLTAGRVTYAGTAGNLVDSADLTFNGTTLTANALTVTNAVTLTGGTANGVAYLNGAKALTTGSALTFDGATNKLGFQNAAANGYAYISNVGAGTNTDLAFFMGATEGMRLTSTGLTVNYANPSSGGATFALNTTTPTEIFDINSNDDYGQFTAALGGSPYLALRFARGNLSAKTTLVSADQQNIVFQGYDGASFINMARITVVAASTVSSGVVPGRFSFDTAAAGSPVSAFHINQNQYCTIGPATVDNVPLYISKPASSAIEAAIYVYPSATPTNSSHILFNSSGVGAVIFGRSNSAGVIQGFTSGTNYSTVLGNTGALPLYFITNQTHAMNISSGQIVTISNTGTSGGAPFSVQTPASSASGYMAELNPSTSTNASVLYINNAGAGSLFLGRASSAGGGAPVAMNNAESFMIHSGTQNLVLGGNSLRALIIDSSGYVTTPYQVSFNVYSNSNLSGAQTPVVFNTVRHNKGSGYSTTTGRFTAPVTGTYFLSVTNNMIQAAGADGLIRKNGSNIIGTEFDPAGSGQWLGLTATTILELVAGDYIDYIVGAGASTTVELVPWNNFVGYLLG